MNENSFFQRYIKINSNDKYFLNDNKISNSFYKYNKFFIINIVIDNNDFVIFIKLIKIKIEIIEIDDFLFFIIVVIIIYFVVDIEKT